MRLFQFERPPLDSGMSCATVKLNEVRPVTALPLASFTVNTTVGCTGAAVGIVTEVMVAFFLGRGVAHHELYPATRSRTPNE